MMWRCSEYVESQTEVIDEFIDLVEDVIEEHGSLSCNGIKYNTKIKLAELAHSINNEDCVGGENGFSDYNEAEIQDLYEYLVG